MNAIIGYRFTSSRRADVLAPRVRVRVRVMVRVRVRVRGEC